jgi:hypothetical protein
MKPNPLRTHIIQTVQQNDLQLSTDELISKTTNHFRNEYPQRTITAAIQELFQERIFWIRRNKVALVHGATQKAE